MGLRERFRLEEIEGDSLLYAPPISLASRDEEKKDDNEEVTKTEKESEKKHRKIEPKDNN